MTVQRGVMLKRKLPPKIKISTVMVLAIILLIILFQVSVAAPDAPFGASTLGDFVWADLNADGVKDPGEPGINGVTITLYQDGSNGNPLDGQIQPSEIFNTATTATDPNSPESTSNDGYYDFSVTAGPGIVYIVEIDDSNFDPGGALEGFIYTGDVSTNVYNGDEPRVVPMPGLQVDYDDADFGYVQAKKVNVGNFIWHDSNNNGLVDAGEDGVDDVEVQLFRDGMDPAVDTPLETQTTSGGGFYGFTDLLPGNYFIYLPNPPADFPMSSVPTDGNDNGEDNDDNGAQDNGFGTEARSPIVTVRADEEPSDDGDGPDGDLTVDFGFFSPVRVGDLVWEDVNNNGLVDPGEPGIPGVEIMIFTLGQDPKVDPPIQTDITDGDGQFSFEDLEPGEYFIYMANPPAGFPNSSDTTDVVANNGTDNNDNGIQAAGPGTEVNSSVFELLSGREPTDDGDGPDGDLTIDFGFYPDPLVNLGDLVWFDVNDNGLVDPGEAGIQGVTVELFNAGDDPTSATAVATETTDGDGLYNFDDLAPGDYFVYLPSPPVSAPTSSTPTDSADNGENDDDNGEQPGGSGTPIQGPVVTLGTDEEPDTPVDGDGTDGDLTVDFGLFAPLSVGNQVWDDADNDGSLDPGEDGIEGVVVELFPAGADPVNSTPLATDTTDADGLYEFDDLAPGDYFLYIPTPPAAQPNSSDNTDLNDNDEDDDDNGDQIGGSGAPVTSPVFNLTSGQESVDDGPEDDGDDSNSNQTLDFGFFADPIVNLGNLVWLDKNDDGKVGADESGLDGVTVELYSSSQTPGTDTPLGSDVTSGGGFYNFLDLAPGDYVVYIPNPPADYPVSSTPTDGADNQEDDDDNGDQPAGAGTAVTSPVITLAADSEPTGDGDLVNGNMTDDDNGDLTVDFGFFAPVSLGDSVWNDADNDGLLDAGEAGIPGVVVELYPAGADPVTDGPIATDTTDGDGLYNFEDLTPGDYFLYIPEPPGDFPASSDDTDPADNGEDDDDNGSQSAPGAPVQSPVISLTSGEESTDDGPSDDGSPEEDSNGDQTVDFGFYEPTGVRLGNQVWYDKDNDGIKDPAEDGINGVMVELYLVEQTAGVDTPVDTDTTDGDGFYSFNDLEPGMYVVYIPEPPVAYPTSSDDTDMADNQEDDDDNGDQPGGPGTPVTSPEITLARDEEPTDDGDDANGDQTVDFGFYAPPMSVGNAVWHDEDNDGILDPDESGIQGVVVALYEAGADPESDDPIGTVTTDENGEYLFENIEPGDYFLYMPEPPADFPTSSDNTDLDDNGQDDDDNGEQPDGAGTAVTSPVFNLTPGTEPAEDGDPNSDETMDFGFYAVAEPVNLGNLVWLDKNNDGLVDADEAGIEGVVVELYEGGADPTTDDPLATDTTDGDGLYNFDELAAGTYFVYIPEAPTVAPASSTPTDMADNGEDNDDNGEQPAGSGTAVRSPDITLGSGEEPAEADDGDGTDGDLTVDFGFYTPVDLGSQVWHDSDNDGLKDSEESGIEGVVVELYEAGDDPLTATPVMTDTTDSGGVYSFEDVAPGDYFVYIPEAPTEQPNSSDNTDPADNGEDDDDNGIQDGPGEPIQSPVISLVSGEEPTDDGDDENSDQTVDFGFYSPVRLGNQVWHDGDNDGIKDPLEVGIQGVVVELYEAGADPVTDGPIATDTTDGDGLYTFEDLSPGDYIVYIPEPPAAQPNSSDDTDPADNGEDDDDNGIQATPGGPVTSPVISLVSGDEPTDDGDDENGDETVDFGFYSPVSLGNQVWHDGDNDGLKDPEEAGIEGILVELFEAGDDPATDPPLTTDTTDGDGLYTFEDISPGDYIVYIPFPPADFPASSDETDSADNGEDDDDNGSQAAPGAPVESPVISLVSGEESTDDGDDENSDQTVDFGFYEPTGVRLGNQVWFDKDNDGLLDPDEDGINDVVVELYEAGQTPGTDTPLRTDTTDGDGFYSFNELEPGTYVVYMPEPPAAYPLSSDDTDLADNGEDNDDNGEQPGGSGTPITSPEITLGLGEEPTDDGDDSDGDQTVDFGLYAPPLSIGDQVWHDENNNGLLDPGEDGIGGVVVELYAAGADPVADDPMATVFTSPEGTYVFDDLGPGDYFLYIPEPPADFPNSSDSTAINDNGEDDDDNGNQPGGRGTAVTSPVINLAPGEEPAGDGDPNSDETVDFGFYPDPIVNLGNLVWFDGNNNGLVDAGEQPIAGVVVELYKVGQVLGMDQPLASDTTDAQGHYNFDELAPGDYVVYIPKPPIEAPASSTPTDDMDNGEDNDDNGNQQPATNGQSSAGEPVRSPVINLAPNQEPTGDGDIERGNQDDDNGDLTVDFGFFMPLSVGNRVWNDENNDGIAQADEAGIKGAVLELYEAGADPTSDDPGDDPIATVTTGPEGTYTFEDVPPGDYFIYLPEPPADYPNSSDNTDLADNGEDNDDNGDQPDGRDTPVTSPVFNLTAGEESINDGTNANDDSTLDFGFFADPLTNLGNLVWLDKNDNGLVDQDEEGIEGVVVELYEGGADPATDTPIMSDTTDENGHYNFDDLTPGTYIVYLPESPADYPASSTPTDGADNGEDDDDNGSQDAIGDPISSPEITLGLGEEPAEADDGDGTDGDLTVDFGLYAPLSVGSQIWHDENNDGMWELSEPGISGIEVQLFEEGADPTDTPVATVTTDENGVYNFDDLAPGDYFIYIPEPPADFPVSSDDTDMVDNGEDDDDNGDQPDGAGTPVTSPVFNLTSGEEPTQEDGDPNTDETQDFGFYKPGVNLGDLVWHDKDNDGAVGPTEAGIADVKVLLFKAGDDPTSDDPVATDVTDENGLYNFNGLEEGTYVVYIPEAPADFPASSDNTDGEDNGEDNDDNGDQPDGKGTPVTSPEITLAVGDEPTDDGDGADGDLTVDFGFYMPDSVNLGDLIWHDANNDSVADPDEDGIEGVTVELYEAGTDPATEDPIATDVTDETGRYNFDDVPEGTYIVYIPEPPADFPISSDNSDGEDNQEDNDDNGDQPDGSGTPVTSPEITLTAGDEPTDDGDGPDGDLTVDFGFYAKTVSLGDLVWFDEDNDGLRGADEVGIEGVTVQLFNADDDPTSATPVATDTTDGEGLYHFPDLAEGTYIVYIPEPPAAHPASSDNTDGEDNGEDNDDNGDQPGGAGTPVTSPKITLTAGQEPMEDGALDDESGDEDGDQTVDFGFWTPAPDIDIEKATNGQDADAGDGPAIVVGEMVKWTYVVENVGNVLLTDISVIDDREGTIECPQSELAVGESMICEKEGLAIEGAYENLGKVDALPPASDEDPSHYTGVPDSKVNLGNQVWHDEDNDSILDADEVGIDGVEVQLFNATDDPINDAPLATDTTSGGGFYAFNGLEPGDYVVYIPEPPLDFPASSSQTTGEDNGQDGDDNGSQPSEPGTPVISPVISLALGDEPGEEEDGDGVDGDLTVDFGFYKPDEAKLNLGNLVWHDLNNNGLVDEGEAGIDGVKVQLFKAGDDPASAEPVQSAITSGGGFYAFMELTEGDYFVYIPEAPTEQPGSSTPTDDADNGEDNDDNGEQSAIGEPVRSPDINLSFANEPAEDVDGDGSNGELTVDFGFWAPSAVGDRVWQDNNANGIQDPGEPNVPGVTVTLFQEDGTPMGMTETTDDQGQYLFSDLPPGSYYVVFDVNSLPDGFSPTKDNQGADDAADSDAFGLDSSAPGQTDPTDPIPSGEQDRTLDMGIFAPVRVGDRVWTDENRNGLQDGGEAGVAGVTVTLFNQDGTTVGDGGMTTTTDAEGNYLFDGLQPGSYYVVFDLTTLPAGFVVTTPNVGEDDGSDSDANPSSGQTAPTAPLSSGEEDMTLDMGIQQPLGVRIGDTVWEDSNANGIQDLGEPGVPGVTVTLFQEDGTPTDRVVTTDENGTYLFEGLSPGSYYVVFDLNSLPDGYRVSDPNVGDDDGQDSDGDPSSGQTPPTSPIPDGDEDLSLDLGVYAPASLGNFVWNDQNANGIQDPGEAGVNGVTVNLLYADGSPVTNGDGTPMTMATDPSGFYQFTGLVPGDYLVEFVAPEGMVFGPADQGDDQTDSDADPDSGRTTVVTLTSGQNDPSWDAGLYETGSIGNFVWDDGNGNGVQDGEAGIPGVVVELYREEENTLVESVITDDGGGYLFDNLPPGNYYVKFTPPADKTYTKFDAGDDDGLDSDVNPTLKQTAVITLNPGEDNDTIDVGFTDPASIGRFVWLDEDQDGIKDDNEPGVAGIVVNLYNSETQELVDTTITDSNGFFEFAELSPGTYALEFKRPTNYVFTEPGQGTGDQFDSDADPLSGITQPLVLLPGESNDDSGAGLVLSETIKDGPQAIDLVSFTAEKQASQNVIRWVTGGEIDTFGFHLYRSINGLREDAVRITKQMIPALGAGGGEYVYEDVGILPDFPYIYWLTEVENGVEADEYGPVGAHIDGNFTNPTEPTKSGQDIYVLYLPIITQ